MVRGHACKAHHVANDRSMCSFDSTRRSPRAGVFFINIKKFPASGRASGEVLADFGSYAEPPFLVVELLDDVGTSPVSPSRVSPRQYFVPEVGRQERGSV